MTTPFVDVVIACHDPARPIARAVASVLADDEARALARVTVVAHNRPAAEFEELLSGIPGSWRILELNDGIPSPAGPFNHGLDAATAEYCAVMGSDDRLEPGALVAWSAAARTGAADMVIAPMRIDGQPVMLNPLPRLRRARRLDAARDRLFYRTAPLGLLRTETIRDLGLRMTDGMRTGEDIEFGVRMLAEAGRVDYPLRAPSYVIGTDAAERTSHTLLDVAATLQPVNLLLDGEVASRLRFAHRRALAIKFIRISLLGAVRARPNSADWQPGDVQALRGMLERLASLAPGVLAPLSRQERELTDAIARAGSADELVAALRRSTAMTSRAERLMTRGIRHCLDRESVLRRYLVYALRERGIA